MSRPSKYKREYAKLLFNHMRKGLSFESFAATVGVNRDTLYNWEELFPEFSDAKKMGADAGQLFWEQLGISLCTGRKTGNASVYIFTMKNRFGWRDVQPVDDSNERVFRLAYRVDSKG